MQRHLRILSIDGGGVRALISAIILGKLEEKMRELSRNPNLKLIDYIDLVAGTSAGALLVSLLLLPGPNGYKYSAVDALQVMMRRIPEIFKETVTEYLHSGAGWAGPAYPASNLEKVLQEEVGDMTLSQLSKEIVIPAVDLCNESLKVFTRDDEYRLRDVLRSTTAAPTYFAPACIKDLAGGDHCFIDGGIVANNPAMLAFIRGEKFYHDLSHVTLISIGTGSSQLNYTPSAALNWGRLHWAVPIINLQISGGVAHVHSNLSSIFPMMGVGSSYFRLNPPLLTASPEMDDCSLANLKRLQHDTEIWLSQHNLEEVALALLRS